ncbi:MAG TPA: hypothetical protein VMY87_01115 [Armatimonadota bacterium]|nr:hypothetical protein [Armatimonadota bacterium]
MGSRLLALRLVPSDVFERLLGDLRARHPQVHVTAVAGGEAGGADDVIDWRDIRGLALVRKLRETRPDIVVVAHGRDHYATRAYWKAVLLALASGARARSFCEDGDLRRPHGLLAGAGRALWQVAQEFCAAAIGLLVFGPLLLMAALTDLTEALAGGAGRSRGRGKTR